MLEDFFFYLSHPGCHFHSWAADGPMGVMGSVRCAGRRDACFKKFEKKRRFNISFLGRVEKSCCFKMEWERARSEAPQIVQCISRVPALVLDRS